MKFRLRLQMDIESNDVFFPIKDVLKRYEDAMNQSWSLVNLGKPIIVSIAQIPETTITEPPINTGVPANS